MTNSEKLHEVLWTVAVAHAHQRVAQIRYAEPWQALRPWMERMVVRHERAAKAESLTELLRGGIVVAVEPLAAEGGRLR